jgi:hypothetical protein
MNSEVSSMARVSNKYGKSIVFAIVLLLASSLLHAKTKAGDWELVKEDEGHDIVVYYRNLKSGNVEFRGITHLRTSLSSFIALLKDFETLPEWAYRTDKVVTLKQNSNTEAYVYTIHPMPWPFMPRDSHTSTRIRKHSLLLSKGVRYRIIFLSMMTTSELAVENHFGN